MNAKQIWGLIFIILGVMAVLGGLNGYYEASVYGEEALSISRVTSKFIGKSYSAAFGVDTDHISKLIDQEKRKCVAGVLLGVSLSILGTLMLSKGTKKPSKNVVEAFSADDTRFRIETSENNIEDDEDRWMHPDMRKQFRK